MRHNLSEQELVQKVKPLLLKKYEVFEEVKIFTRSIDLILKKKDTIIAVEFKLRNWKKAFEQIMDYQLVTDYSYLCIPKTKLKEDTLLLLKERGIGLLTYDLETNILVEEVKPSSSKEKVDFYRDYLFQKVLKL